MDGAPAGTRTPTVPAFGAGPLPRWATGARSLSALLLPIKHRRAPETQTERLTMLQGAPLVVRLAAVTAHPHRVGDRQRIDLVISMLHMMTVSGGRSPLVVIRHPASTGRASHSYPQTSHHECRCSSTSFSPSAHGQSEPSQYTTVGGVGGGGGAAGSCFCVPSAPFGPSFGSGATGSGIENPHFTHFDFGSNGGRSSSVTLQKIDTKLALIHGTRELAPTWSHDSRFEERRP